MLAIRYPHGSSAKPACCHAWHRAACLYSPPSVLNLTKLCRGTPCARSSQPESSSYPSSSASLLLPHAHPRMHAVAWHPHAFTLGAASSSISLAAFSSSVPAMSFSFSAK